MKKKFRILLNTIAKSTIENREGYIRLGIINVTPTYALICVTFVYPFLTPIRLSFFFLLYRSFSSVDVSREPEKIEKNKREKPKKHDRILHLTK